ncbi:ubiquitin-protein ligase peroxin 12 [Basidiobolus ranarum]|uniref:Peroxisome assembly protein 12 n=1 Tax=Basidiobolus ranarum TaxID=34480 RepID=A0ABR2W6D1_9FUNG
MEYMSNIGDNRDMYRPSLFELVAQDKMRDMLQPAVRYVLTVYAQRYPRYLLRIVNKFEEVFNVVMFFVERHYLRRYGGTFAENFYGLKRTRTQKIEESDKLTERDIYNSLFFSIGLPYLKSKLDSLYEKVSGGSGALLFGDEFSALGRSQSPTEQLSSKEKFKARIKKLFKTIYPFINCAYHLAALGYNIGYLYDRTAFYTPWLRLIGVQVRRLDISDYKEMYQHQNRPGVNWSSLSRTQLLKRLVLTGIERGFDFLKVLLPMSIFFFKFLEWWYSSEYSRTQVQQPIPPPPEPVKPDPNGIPLPEDRSQCPLCQRERTNPTMLPTGYVFCYPCIFKYVEEYKCCPVTLMSTGTEQLRKIYSVGM